MPTQRDPIYPNQSNPSKTERWGEIDKFVPQNSPSYLDGSEKETTITQVFKGPTAKVELFMSFCDAMLKSNTQATKTLAYFMGNTDGFIQWAVGAYVGTTPMYTVMFPPGSGNQTYIIDSYSIEETDAGLMSIVRVKFKRAALESSQQEDPDPDYTYWTCNMAQTQIDVLAYCTNTSDTSGQGGEEQGSFATNIQTWMNQTEDTAVLKPEWKYQSVLGAKEIKTLNAAEIAIAQKLIAGKSPLRHYPVVVRNEVYSAKPKVEFDLIDHIGDPPDCPFTLIGWKWLCTGINVNYNSYTNMTQVATEWTGSTEWDVNFYGESPDRWEFGKVDVPAVTPQQGGN